MIALSYAEQPYDGSNLRSDDENQEITVASAGHGGLGEATLHHVYADSVGTGELTLAVRQGQLPGRRISAAHVVSSKLASQHSADNNPKTLNQQPTASASHQVQEQVADSQGMDPEPVEALPQGSMSPLAPGAVLDADGMTTKLLMDDRHTLGWSHVPIAGASIATGRGSVGSNVVTMNLVSACNI